MRHSIGAIAITLPLLIGGAASAAAQDSTASCAVTIPTHRVPSTGGFGPENFSYGHSQLRVHISWPRGRLPVGRLPDGGSWATVQADGSIRTKVGWWRGTPGYLKIRGRRLDETAPPLRSSVPSGYGKTGFTPSSLIFPVTGCWRVVGTVGDARLTFVVEVVKIRRSSG